MKTGIYGNSLMSVRQNSYLEAVSGKRISDESKLRCQFDTEKYVSSLNNTAPQN